jgi:outer membrane protein OmpA-like peptidoglycan-associated protein
VRDYLVKQGVAAERNVAEGSSISTKYDNAEEASRALNRRTDVIFFDQPKDTRATK